MADIHAGVTEEQLPFLVGLAAIGGLGVGLRHRRYSGGAPNDSIPAYSGEPADSEARRAHLNPARAAGLYPDSLSHLYPLPNLHTVPNAGTDGHAQTDSRAKPPSDSGSNTNP